MSRLLLDTEALIWWDANDARLGGNARAAIQAAADVFVSAASAWEIVIKQALGKLRAARRPAAAVADAGFTELAVGFAHAEQVLRLPQHHRDPFDRLIIATAQVEDCVLVTSDEAFGAYSVKLLDARK